MKLLSLLFVFVMALTLPHPSHAAEPAQVSVPSQTVTAPSGSAAAVTVEAPTQAAELAQAPEQGFFEQFIETVKKYGSLDLMGKISAIILLIVASMKVSFLNNLLWSKLGDWKSAVAPALGLIAGVLSAFVGHKDLSFAAALGIIVTYFGSGVGALGLHELLDDIKAIKGIGPVYVAIIEAVQSALGGPKAKSSP